MAITTTTSQTELKSSFIRIDAEFFRPKHVAAYKTLDGIDGRYRLGQLCEKVTQGSNPVFSISGLPCVNGKNIYFGTMQEGEPNYVSEQEFNRLSNYCLRKNDIVITLKHATKIGRAWIVENENPPKIFSRNVGLIRLAKDSSIIPSVLLMYLWSKSGQLCLDRCATGGTSGQITLPISELKRIPIPPFPETSQLEVNALFQKSKEAAHDTEKCYQDAQHLLESELGIDKLKFKKPVGYTARFSDTTTNGRFDADYYHPKFAAIQQTVKNYSNGYEPLISIATALKPNIDPAKTPNQRYNYIELSNINPTLGTVDGFGSMLGKELPSRARRQVINGDIIASAVVGSVDKAAIIDTAQSGFIASTGFFHFRPISVSSEYLLILIKSKCVCMQFQQQSTGGILSAVPDSRLKNIIVPKLPEKLQQKIRNLVFQSHRAKKRSQELLNQAKARVEQLIEEASEG